MTLTAPTSSDYEAEANRLRAQIGATVEDLRFSLRPSNSLPRRRRARELPICHGAGRLILPANATRFRPRLLDWASRFGHWRRFAAAKPMGSRPLRHR